MTTDANRHIRMEELAVDSFVHVQQHGVTIDHSSNTERGGCPSLSARRPRSLLINHTHRFGLTIQTRSMPYIIINFLFFVISIKFSFVVLCSILCALLCILVYVM